MKSSIKFGEIMTSFLSLFPSVQLSKLGTDRKGIMLELANVKALLAAVMPVEMKESWKERAIVNGYDAPSRLFYVRLSVKDTSDSRRHCGGALVSAYQVFSAAHCCPHWLDLCTG